MPRATMLKHLRPAVPYVAKSRLSFEQPREPDGLVPACCLTPHKRRSDYDFGTRPLATFEG